MTYQLGTHNSMSYLKPLKWWHKPFHFMSRCQRVSIQEQYEKHNARYFDLRVRQDKKSHWQFAHGATLFKGETLDSVLAYLNGKCDVVVRIVLEERKRDLKIEETFRAYCKGAMYKYSNVGYIGCYTKADWSEQLAGDVLNPSIYEAVSSTTGNILDDWCPYFYAKRYNKDNYAQGTAKDFLV